MELLLISVGLLVICVAGGLFGAETRPDFLDPRVKHDPGSVTAWLQSR